MWEIVLVVLVLLIGWWSWTRGPGIVVPIPVSVIETTKRQTGNGWLLAYRILILIGIVATFSAFVASDPSFVWIGLISALAAAFLFQPIRQALLDIWNFRFPTFGGN